VHSAQPEIRPNLLFLNFTHRKNSLFYFLLSQYIFLFSGKKQKTRLILFFSRPNTVEAASAQLNIQPGPSPSRARTACPGRNVGLGRQSATAARPAWAVMQPAQSRPSARIRRLSARLGRTKRRVVHGRKKTLASFPPFPFSLACLTRQPRQPWLPSAPVGAAVLAGEEDAARSGPSGGSPLYFLPLLLSLSCRTQRSSSGPMADRRRSRWQRRRQSPRRCARPPRGGRAAVEWSGGGALYRRARGVAATVGGVPLPRAVAVATAGKKLR